MMPIQTPHVGVVRPCYDEDSERVLLGHLIASPDGAKVGDVLTLVRPEDFYVGAHAAIYRVVADLCVEGHPVNLVSVNAEMLRRNMQSDYAVLVSHDSRIDSDTPSFVGYLTGLVDRARLGPPDSAARCIRACALKRRARAVLQEGVAACDNGTTTENAKDLLSNLRAQIQQIEIDYDHHDGFAATDLLDVAEPAPFTELLDCPGALTRGLSIMFIAGQSSARKSWLVLELVKAVATGTPLPPLRIREPATKTRVLYLALDTYRDRAYGRFAPLRSAMQHGQVEAVFRGERPGFDLLSPKPRREFVEYIQSGAFGLVVIDTIRWVHSANEMDQKEMHDFVAALDQIVMAGAAVLGVCHVPKGKEDTDPSLDLLRGASSLGNAIHTAATVKGGRQDPLSELSWVKANDCHPWPEPFCYRITDGRFEYVPVIDASRDDPLQNTILDIISTVNADPHTLPPSKGCPFRATFNIIMDQVRLRVPKGKGNSDKTIRNLLAALVSKKTLSTFTYHKRGSLAYGLSGLTTTDEDDLGF